MAPLPDLTAPDALLCERAGDGDSAAFQLLVRRYAPMMRAYAIRLTGSTADADDVLQETLIRAWEKIDTVQDPSKVKSWLMTLTSRKAIDHIRARKLTSNLEEASSSEATGVSPEDSAIADSQMNQLAKVLKTLPLEQQQVWVMREVGGFSYKEISEQLNISDSAVRGRLARARVALLEGMEAWH